MVYQLFFSPMKQQDEVNQLTIKQFSERTGLSPVTVRDHCVKGHLKGAKLVETLRGPIWLIPENNLTNFQRRKRGGQPGNDNAKKR